MQYKFKHVRCSLGSFIYTYNPEALNFLIDLNHKVISIEFTYFQLNQETIILYKNPRTYHFISLFVCFFQCFSSF